MLELNSLPKFNGTDKDPIRTSKLKMLINVKPLSNFNSNINLIPQIHNIAPHLIPTTFITNFRILELMKSTEF